MTRKRLYIFLTSIILTSIVFIGLFADFVPFTYYKLKKNPNAWLQIYAYQGQHCCTKMLKALQNFKSDKVDVIFIPNSMGRVDYQDVFFYDKETKNYYHTCFDMDSVRFDANNAYINLIHISKAKEFPCNNPKAINRDFNFVTNYKIIKRFESLVLEKLKVD